MERNAHGGGCPFERQFVAASGRIDYAPLKQQEPAAACHLARAQVQYRAGSDYAVPAPVNTLPVPMTLCERRLLNQ
jgi:hypothetical protein